MPIPRAIANKNKKFDSNITKRGNVTLGKTVAEKKAEEKPQINKFLVAFFLIVVVGSSVVQILNMFMNSGNKPPSSTEE